MKNQKLKIFKKNGTISLEIASQLRELADKIENEYKASLTTDRFRRNSSKGK